MTGPDLNLLMALNVLLTEGSVVRAAERLQLSASAMSRTLARLRDVTGDPLLVRAGRGLVPTPHAIMLAETVGPIVAAASACLRPVDRLDLAHVERTFTLRTSEGFVENFGPGLIARLDRDAPGIRLRFVSKPDKDSTPLREGSIDLETGVVGKAMGPELRAQALFGDRFIGVVRKGHPLAGGAITPEAYAQGRHIAVARKGNGIGPIDSALAALGLSRYITTIVSGFSTALALARGSDLIANVPERHTGNLRDGMISFALPVATPNITISLFWHPRMDADPAHRWLRGAIMQACNGQNADG